MDLASRAYILLGFILLLGVLAGGILYAGKKLQERNNQGGSFDDLDTPVAKPKKTRVKKEKKAKTVKPAEPSRREKKVQADAGVIPLTHTPTPQAPPSTPMQAPVASPPASPQPTAPPAAARPAAPPPPPAQTAPPRTSGSPFKTHEEGDSEW